MRLFLRGKKIILNQILFPRCYTYIGQIYTIPKHIKKEIEKRIRNFPRNKKKYNLQTLSLILYFEGGLSNLDIDTQLNYNNKMDSKVIKSHQRSLERSHAVLIEINSETWSRPSPSIQKQILTGLLVTKVYKNRAMKISLFNYSILGYI